MTVWLRVWYKHSGYHSWFTDQNAELPSGNMILSLKPRISLISCIKTCYYKQKAHILCKRLPVQTFATPVIVWKLWVQDNVCESWCLVPACSSIETLSHSFYHMKLFCKTVRGSRHNKISYSVRHLSYFPSAAISDFNFLKSPKINEREY